MDTIVILFFVVVGTFVVYSKFSEWGLFNRLFGHGQIKYEPILFSYFINPAKLVIGAHGKAGKLHLTSFLVTNNVFTLNNESSALIYRVELPFSSNIHLMNITNTSGADRPDPTGIYSLMERVELEGDYHNYFSLYCQKGMQQQARYVLDPKAMAFVIDFCQSHHWELINNELYFLQQSGTEAAEDPTAMYTDIDTFIQEIKPAVAKPLSENEIALATPYGKNRRDDLLCPVCQRTMTNMDAYFSCPQGDGILVMGNKLKSLLKSKKLSKPPGSSKQTRQLNCPSCRQNMVHVAYNASDTYIDSCSNCPYRWLDVTDLAL